MVFEMYSVRVGLLVVAVPAIYWLLLALGRRLKRRHGVRLGWAYQLFAACLSLYVPGLALQFDWPFIKHLGAATVLLGALFASAMIDRFLWELYFEKGHRVKIPKFLSDLARLVLLVVAVFVVLDVGYDQTLKGLLTPGVIAVIVGIAMQDLMGNLVSGIALQLGKPYVLGDWLWVENQYAKVLEINWRSTRLRTLDDITIDVPNRDLAKATITNLNQPQRRHAMRLTVNTEYSAPPAEVKRILQAAAATATGVVAEPAPLVFLKNFGDFAVEYELKFWMDDHELYPAVCDTIRTTIWYSFQRHGLRIPYPVRTLHRDTPARENRPGVTPVIRHSLRQQPLFQCLTEAQLDTLLAAGRFTRYGAHETIIRQGDAGASMFILVRGEAQVTVARTKGPLPIAELGAGDCFGEMSLLTGEPRSATVKARSDCDTVEIDKAGLAASLRESPELLEQLSALLARRQMSTEAMVAARLDPTTALARQNEFQNTFACRLKAFFEL